MTAASSRPHRRYGSVRHINTAIAERDQGLDKPVAVVAVYPVATTSIDTPSEKEQAAAKPLNTPMMAWFVKYDTNRGSDTQDPRRNLVDANLKGSPPVTIINAEIDPLKSDGDMLAAKLKEAGVETRHQLTPARPHEFFGMDPVVAKAKEAQEFAVAQIKKGFGSGMKPQQVVDLPAALGNGGRFFCISGMCRGQATLAWIAFTVRSAATAVSVFSQSRARLSDRGEFRIWLPPSYGLAPQGQLAGHCSSSERYLL